MPAKAEIHECRATSRPVVMTLRATTGDWPAVDLMRTSIRLAYVLGALPLEERFAVAINLGFDAVECPFPYEVPASRYAKLLKDNGLQQISIDAPACDYKGGESGFSLPPGLKSRFDRSVDTVIEYAKAIGCTQVHVFAGPKSPEVSEALAFETYCDRIAEAHDRLQVEGLSVVIETVNSKGFKGYFMDRLDLVMRAINQIDRRAVEIILDVYHAHVNGENPVEFLKKHGGKVAHVQLADYPGRHEPGTGMIDFPLLFDTLRAIHYSGSVGLEYVPTRSAMAGVPLADELNLKNR
jgi:hydroxypyruvate isomerase